jgi:hypothetical protein
MALDIRRREERQERTDIFTTVAEPV